MHLPLIQICYNFKSKFLTMLFSVGLTKLTDLIFWHCTVYEILELRPQIFSYNWCRAIVAFKILNWIITSVWVIPSTHLNALIMVWDPRKTYLTFYI